METKKMSLYYFTGTGNTYLVSKKIAETFSAAGYQTELKQIEKTNRADLTGIIGIGFPIAAWNTYPLVKKFLQNLPAANVSKCFLFSTMGDSSANATQKFAEFLQSKGYKVLGARDFKMPNNMLLIEPDEKNKAKTEIALAQAEQFAQSIITGAARVKSAGGFTNVSFAITNFVWKILQTKPVQKLFKFKLKKDLCVKCKKCAEYCPAQNIALNAEGYPEFNLKCNFCLRCVSYCPKRAIKFFVLNCKIYRALDAQGETECFTRKF